MRTSHRFVALVAADVALLVLSATLAGGSTGTSSTPQASVRPKASQSASLTPAEARRIAAAGVLGKVDMPGFLAAPVHRDASSEARDAQFIQCLGLSAPSWVARDHGTRFTKGALEVTSSVDVARSPAIARKELAALGGRKAEGCIREALEYSVSPTGMRLTRLSMTPVKIRVQGAEAALVQKVSFFLESRGRQGRIRILQLAAAVGPAEVSVTVIDPGATSGFTFNQGVALLRKAAARTRAALAS